MMDAPFDYTQDRLRQTYRFIESYQARTSLSPTEREIGAAFGLTRMGAHHRLARLQKLGWVRREGTRAITLLGLPRPERVEGPGVQGD